MPSSRSAAAGAQSGAGQEQQIEITQTRSLIGRVEGQRRTMRALGLRKIRQTVTQPDRPEIRGMIGKVAHLVEVRYLGEAVALDLEPGQEPKGAGNPAAGHSVADEESAERAEALEEIREQEVSTPLGDLVGNAPTLTSVENPDRPKATGGPLDDDVDDVDEDGADADEAAPEGDLVDTDGSTEEETR